jgi:predicted DsbA family dithiol-disulfide isomerase
VVVERGEKLGLDGDEIRDVLATDRYADAVRADHNAAIRLGARGVPFTVLGGRLGVPGAVSTEQYAAAIDQAWEHVHA